MTRPIVSYPQIMELSDFHCFVRLPGSYPITKLQLKLLARATKSQGFIERSMPPTFNAAQLPSFKDEPESDGVAPVADEPSNPVQNNRHPSLADSSLEVLGGDHDVI